MTATLYHRTEAGWQRTVLRDVWFRLSRGTGHNGGYGREDAAESLLLIPWRPGLALDPEDGIFSGEGPEVGSGALKALLPEVRIITEVTLHRPGSPLDHWEVTAR